MLKIVAAAIAFSAVVSGIVLAAVNPHDVHRAVETMLGIVWTGGFASVGAVTVVFAILQRTGAAERMQLNWKVDELPRFSHQRRRAPRWFEHAADIVVQALFLLFWTGLLPPFWSAVIPAEPHGVLTLGCAPVWQTLYWPVIWLALAAIVVDAVRLSVPQRRRLGHGLDIIRHAGLAALAVVALAAGHWAVVTGIDMAPGVLAKVDKGVNTGVEVALIVVIVASVGAILRDAWRIFRPASAPASRAA